MLTANAMLGQRDGDSDPTIIWKQRGGGNGREGTLGVSSQSVQKQV